mgnify:CR=1 FL=1
MPQSSAQQRKYCDTAGNALMKHDIPFVAIEVVAVAVAVAVAVDVAVAVAVAVVECHS